MTIFACDMRHRKSIDHIHQVRGGFSPSGEPLLSWDEELRFWGWSLLLRFGAAMVPDVTSMVPLVALGEALPYRWVVLIQGVSVRGSGRVMEDGPLAA